MSDYTVHIGIEHLSELDTCVSLAVDTETLQLQPEKGKLRLIQLGSLARKTIVLIDCFDLDDVGWSRLRHFFSNGERFWLAHNAVFDLGWLQEHNLHPRGRMRCSMIASKLLYNGMPNLKHSLAHVVKRVLKEDLDKEQQASNWGAPVLSQEQLEYAAKDVIALLELDEPLDHRLAEGQLSRAFALECRALPAMAAMWRTGLPWNADALQDLKKDYEFDIQELGKEFVWKLDEALPEDSKLPRLDDGTFNLNPRTTGSVRLGTKVYAGFNLNSPRQLIDKFTALLGEPPVDPKTERPSASRAALKNYAADHEVIAIYLSWKKAEKRRQMVESIQEKLGPDGFVRASYLQLGAETGRMSCVAGDTVLITSRGDFTFEEYIPREGDLVLTHRGRWMPVVRKLYRGVEETIEVVTAEGGRLCCTSDHKLWTGSSWVKVADLSVGDTLGLFKEVGSAAGEHQSGVGRVSKRSASHGVSGCGDTELHVSQCGARAEGAANAGKTSGGKGSAAVTRESRGVEPYEGQEWFPAPQVHRGVRGPEGLPDCAQQQRKEGVSASGCDGSGFGPRRVASALGSSSHRRGHTEQRSGQSGVSNLESAQSFTPSATQVESVKSVGSMGVWDIEVEGDHSYALYGFLSHNCIKPNNQQIPRDENFRACVEAPEGWVLIDADFGQMELRLAAAVAQDERMTKAFQDGEDLHTVTAAALGCDRQIAKSANFGLLYGSGAKGLRNYAGAMGVQITLEEAQTIRQQWLDTYYGIHKWQRSNALAADNTEGDPWAEVRIPVTGFRRFLPGDMNRLTVRCNTPIQGAGAAILKCALGALWPHLLEAGEEIVKLAAVVHDEVVLLVREGYEKRWAEILKDVMERAEAKWLGEIPALAEVHVGKTWSDVH